MELERGVILKHRSPSTLQNGEVIRFGGDPGKWKKKKKEKKKMHNQMARSNINLHMARKHHPMANLLRFLVTLITFSQMQQAWASTNLQCLIDFKNSITDSTNALSTWNTENTSDENYICYWRGVSCFSNNAIPVYKISLENLGLGGTWPSGLNQCPSLQTLDLTGNSFTGPISTTLSTDIPNLVYLDVSHNSISGSIPNDLGSCKFLNDLILDDNQLTGDIPASIGQLDRLAVFSVANNQLSGTIPSTFTNRNNASAVKSFNASSFEGNTYLCGAPLTGPCKTKSSKTSTGVIVGGVVGGLAVLVALAALLLWYFVGQSRRTADMSILRDESKWAKRIPKPRGVTVSMFEKPIVKIKLADLMLATNDFSKDKIIGNGRTGTVYKAAFPDGSVMAIKRLQVNVPNEREFKAEMETLGHLRHRNLVPLLGYCIAGGERLLVYKHMPNGSVCDRLHSAAGMETPLDWPERVKIALGSARGLAWLHHSCNPRVIHRNISNKSILLDDDNEPRITDFGFARLLNPADTHVSTFVNGDFGDPGYVAPEYMRTLVATTKGDVYSLGVVLLELVTGQKPVDVVAKEEYKGNLVDHVLQLAAAGRMMEGVDPVIRNKGVDDEIMQVFKVASSSVVLDPKERPTMFEVFQLLRAIAERYNYTDPFDDLPTITTTDGGGGEDVTVSLQ
jgi:hypothetical protein